MPKSPRPPSSDEASLMESISRKPEILETINQAFASGRKKQKEIYDELAQNFNCEADLLRKVYIKLRQTKEVKKSKHHLGETRPKSAQSVSSESSRRSARLLIKEGSTASSIVGESVDTSCASSLCSVSPPTKECILTEDKPTRKTRSSVRNLCPISELEPVVVDNVTTTVLPPDSSTTTTTTAASSTTTTASTTTTSSVVPTAAANNTAATAAQQDKKRHHQQPLKQQQAEEHDAGDEDEDTQSEATIVTVDEQATTNCNTSGSTTSKYLQESNFSEPSKPTLCRMGRFSEPTQIPKLTQTTPSLTSGGGGGGGSSRKSLSNKSFSKSTNSGSGSRENRGLLNPAEEPTRVFFESMGLTVMNFPQHLQASVKVQVSNIVHDLEYELTSPHTTAEQKASIVVS